MWGGAVLELFDINGKEIPITIISVLDTSQRSTIHWSQLFIWYYSSEFTIKRLLIDAKRKHKASPPNGMILCTIPRTTEYGILNYIFERHVSKLTKVLSKVFDGYPIRIMLTDRCCAILNLHFNSKDPKKRR